MYGAIQIEEKELLHYTNNCYTLGTQAALLAGCVYGPRALSVQLADNKWQHAHGMLGFPLPL